MLAFGRTQIYVVKTEIEISY